MFIAGMGEYDVHHYTDAQFAGPVHEGGEIAGSAGGTVDAIIVCNIVAIIFFWRRLEWRQPDNVNAKVFEIREPGGEAFEVADAIAITVLESMYVEIIYNGVFVPPFGDRRMVSQGRAVLLDNIWRLATGTDCEELEEAEE